MSKKQQKVLLQMKSTQGFFDILCGKINEEIIVGFYAPFYYTWIARG